MTIVKARSNASGLSGSDPKSGFAPRTARPAAKSRSDMRAAEVRGRLAELIAAGLLMLKGYRIVERRHRGPFGEIDLIAVRGRRIAFVEVKQRSSIDAAKVAVAADQASRMSDAAERFLWRHPRYREHRVGLDLVVMGRSMVPRHIEGALHAW